MPEQIEKTVRLEYLGTGDEATGRTVEIMAELVRQSSQNWRVRHTATQLVKDIPERDLRGEILAIFNWVRSNLRFTKDPYGTEMLHRPIELLEDIAKEGAAHADCDDASMLLNALLMSVGHPTGFRTISTRPDGKYNHIYSIVFAKGDWYPLDASDKKFPAGWQVPRSVWTRHFDYQVKP